METWKDIKGYEGLYMLSTRGRVRSLPRVVVRRNGRQFTVKGGLVKLHADGSGHLQVRLCRQDGQRFFLVHRLILETFVGPCPVGMECRHLDDNPVNNKLSNLVWGTRLENQQDRILNGRTNKGKRLNVGSANGNASLDEDKVKSIRWLNAEGYGKVAISRMLNVGEGAVRAVLSGATWKHVV